MIINMRAKWIVAILTVIAIGAFALDSFNGHPDQAVAVDIISPQGERMGVIVVQPVPRGRTLVTANVFGLTPGYHGFHVHETGLCEVDGENVFTSAGGHFDMNNATHGHHSGDLPPLLADDTGRAFLAVHTDRFHLRDLFDDDGSAFIIHAEADNFANIPERYGEPDSATLATGDAGPRIACGVIAPPKE